MLRVSATVCAALVAILLAAWHLEQSSSGLSVTTRRLGHTPVTVFRQLTPPRGAPVVLIAHGFAGSQQLMQPIAVTLARNGFIAVTFDFPGHGRNPEPMRGGLSDPDASLRTLLAATGEVGDFARGLAVEGGGHGRYAIVGHSMASDIVVRHAQAHPEVQATVAVSLFAPSITAATPPDSPRNLRVIDGALEPGMMAAEALRVTGRAVGTPVQLNTTYGRLADGTARRASLSPGVEHIGVLYSGQTLVETLDWLDAAFDRPQARNPFIDARGRWLACLLVGIVVLAWPLSRLLPRVAYSGATPPARRRWWSGHRQALLFGFPAVVTPLALWKLPGDFLPILLGDYLVLHFALYGLLTLVLLWTSGHRPAPVPRGRMPALGLAILLAGAYALLALGVPLDRYAFNMRPEAVRLPYIAVLCAGTLPYFLADEWLTRDPTAPMGAYLASKVLFLLSLVVAIALNPQRLFFLAIIVPAILLLFIVYGLFSRWTFGRTGHPAVAATANAVAFGYFIAVTFPLVA